VGKSARRAECRQELTCNVARELALDMTQTWQPERTLQIVAGTPPGGGLDRVARALVKAIEQSGLIRVPVEVINVPGDGARRVWTHYVDNHAGDGHVIGVSSPNLTTDYLVGIGNFEHSRYTPVATLITEYIVFAVRTDSTLRNGSDLLGRLGGRKPPVTVALSTSLGNPNHVALAKLIRHAGGDINAPIIRVFDTALDAVADVIAGTADVCAVTAASVLAALKSEQLRLVGITAPERLAGEFVDTPTWKEQGADCVIGAWRGATGPAGLGAAEVSFWQRLLAGAVEQPIWIEELSRLSWSPMFLSGPALHAYLARERTEFVAILGELGLLKAR
jgi:putative tricarboxylic transport membrane protein